MKKIICAAVILLLWGGMLSISRDETWFTGGVPAWAQCSTWEIKNNCCFKFIKVLESGEITNPPENREKKAEAEFKRCLRMDLGCSSELIALKAKSAKEIRSYCK